MALKISRTICKAKKSAVEAYDENEPFADLKGLESDEPAESEDEGETGESEEGGENDSDGVLDFEEDEASEEEDEGEKPSSGTQVFADIKSKVKEINNVLEGAKKPANEWHVVKALSYKPDRVKALKKSFKKDFPHIPFDSGEDILALVSRSSMLQEWYAGFNLKFQLEETVPGAYREVIKDAAAFTKAQKLISQHSDLNRQENDKIKDIQLKALNDIKKVKVEIKKKEKN